MNDCVYYEILLHEIRKLLVKLSSIFIMIAKSTYFCIFTKAINIIITTLIQDGRGFFTF